MYSAVFDAGVGLTAGAAAGRHIPYSRITSSTKSENGLCVDKGRRTPATRPGRADASRSAPCPARQIAIGSPVPAGCQNVPANAGFQVIVQSCLARSGKSLEGFAGGPANTKGFMLFN